MTETRSHIVSGPDCDLCDDAGTLTAATSRSPRDTIDCPACLERSLSSCAAFDHHQAQRMKRLLSRFVRWFERADRNPGMRKHLEGELRDLYERAAPITTPPVTDHARFTPLVPALPPHRSSGALTISSSAKRGRSAGQIS